MFGVIMGVLVLLVITLTIPFYVNESDILYQTSLQSMRAQRMSKDVLILTYRPSISTAQAISEIQNTLPVWEQEQSTLNATVGLDSRPLFVQSQPDYTSIDTALRSILAHAQQPIDRTQVQIVLDHEQHYTQTINQLSSLRQQHIQQSNILLAGVQIMLAVLVLAGVISLMLSSKEDKAHD